MASKVTIKEIAEKADVSIATVSNVLTHKKHVSTQLTQRVYAAIETLGYRPNAYARTLKTNRSYFIGVQVPDITNPFFSDIVKTIQLELKAHGYQIILFSSDSVPQMEEDNINSMLNVQVDGIINIAPRMEIELLLNLVGIPMVIVDQPPVVTENNVAFVYADNYSGSMAVADYLIDKGYDRFICLAGPIDRVSNARMRVNGFMDTLKINGIDASRCCTRYGDFSFKSGYELMNDILKDYRADGKPAAAFVTSDIMAWGAMEALKDKKMKIPRDMGIVGYDNVYFSSYLFPKLSTVQNPSREMAINAAQLLIGALEKSHDLKGVFVKLHSSLIVRNST